MYGRTTLEKIKRGDEFEREFTLAGAWLYADFTGGIRFVLRKTIPTSSVVTDADAMLVASIASGNITSSAANKGIVKVSGDVTALLATGKVYFDLQGVISGTPDIIYTIDDGETVIEGDVARAKTG